MRIAASIVGLFIVLALLSGPAYGQSWFKKLGENAQRVEGEIKKGTGKTLDKGRNEVGKAKDNWRDSRGSRETESAWSKTKNAGKKASEKAKGTVNGRQESAKKDHRE